MPKMANTLEYLIDVGYGIIVLDGYFLEINKRRGWNKHIGWKIHVKLVNVGEVANYMRSFLGKKDQQLSQILKYFGMFE